MWYGSVVVTDMDTVSVLNDMIDVRDGWGSCSIYFKHGRCYFYNQ